MESSAPRSPSEDEDEDEEDVVAFDDDMADGAAVGLSIIGRAARRRTRRPRRVTVDSRPQIAGGEPIDRC